MMVSRHGYRVLWPLACTVIHSGAIKSDVTQTSTEERYVGIHAHLSLPLSFLLSFIFSTPHPPFCFSLSSSSLLRETLRGCIRVRAETARKKKWPSDFLGEFSTLAKLRLISSPGLKPAQFR